MKSLSRHQTLIAIVGTAALTAGFYYGVFRPGRITVQQIQREIADFQSQIDNIPVLIAERTQLQARLDRQVEQVLELDERVPTQTHVSEVLHQVASLARRSGLTITRLEPLPPTEFSSYVSHPFHLNCRGSFQDVARFLSGLETQSRLVTFGDAEFNRGSEGGASGERTGIIHANLHFNVYSRHAKTTKVAENASSRRLLASDK